MKRPIPLLLAVALLGAMATGCSTTEASAGTAETVAGSPQAEASEFGAVGTLDSSLVHTIEVSFGKAVYGELIETYRSTGDKEWIEATVTINGVTYEQAGIRLKGNSSLFSLSPSSDPETLPWLIKLDKYIDGQHHEGLTDLVVRSSNSETALNEAVALELLELAGLASQDAIAAAFSINGSEPILRLVIEHPDDVWMAEEFDTDGALYKAESTGDYSYRGDDLDAYDEVFDQEAGKDNTDLSPLIDFLGFINNSDDATFVAELEQWLDIDSFATYLAMQELIDNQDDIDGRGNNSYLHYNTDTGEFTVVAWDHNLAFGLTPGPGDRADLPSDFAAGGFDEAPAPGDIGAGTRPPGGPEERPGGQGTPGAPGLEKSNVLVERFLANDAWSALVETQTEELRAELYDSGVAEQILSDWSDIVAASGLVDAATIESEAAQIRDTLAS
jgi:spore coat protein CotH